MTKELPPEPAALSISHPYRVATLNGRKPQRFDIRPDAAALANLARVLGVTAVRRVVFAGEIQAARGRDFVLTADLSANIEQPCGITLAPVQTEIRETVIRRYVADLPEPDADEIEMPEDDTTEPLPEVIDAGAVLAEALALAIPMYPRAPGAELAGETVFGPPGVAPLRSEDLRPFAGLAGLAGLAALVPKNGSDDDTEQG